MWTKVFFCVKIVFGYTEENYDFRRCPRYSSCYDHGKAGSVCSPVLEHLLNNGMILFSPSADWGLGWRSG